MPHSPNLYFKTGDQFAFTQVFDHFYGPLCGFANYILQDKCSAQDVVSDVFIKLWEKGGEFSSIYSLKGWLFVTTRNTCYNVRKHVKRHNTLTDECFNFIAGFTREQQIVRVEQINAVISRVDTLPPKCKTVFHLSFFQGFSDIQIATLCGIAVSTVKNQRARAIKLLRKKLQGHI